jgi:hypothetical protein
MWGCFGYVPRGGGVQSHFRDELRARPGAGLGAFVHRRQGRGGSWDIGDAVESGDPRARGPRDFTVDPDAVPAVAVGLREAVDLRRAASGARIRAARLPSPSMDWTSARQAMGAIHRPSFGRDLFKGMGFPVQGQIRFRAEEDAAKERRAVVQHGRLVLQGEAMVARDRA